MIRQVAAAIGALVLAYATAGFGLGFGPVEVVSALNEPLQAHIPLLAVKPEERDDVSVKIASPSTFTRFGVSRAPILDHIETEIVPGTSPTRMRVLLTSQRPIREPFLTFLVEANWSGRRAIREYTILLDPPVSAPVVAAKAPTGPLLPQAGALPAAEPPARPEPAPAPPPQPVAPLPPPQDPPSPAAAADEPGAAADRRYGPVEPHQTLWSIAAATRPNRAITMDQMLLAIYQANVEDFDGNMNLMFEGAVLTIPGAAEIAAINARVASGEVADQARAFARLAAPPSTTKTTASPKGELRLEPPPEQAARSGPTQPQIADAGNGAASTEQPQGAGSDTLAALAQAARAGAPEGSGASGELGEPRPVDKDRADPSAAASKGRTPGEEQTLAAGAGLPETSQKAGGVEAPEAPADAGEAADQNAAPRMDADADGGLAVAAAGGVNTVALAAADAAGPATQQPSAGQRPESSLAKTARAGDGGAGNAPSAAPKNRAQDAAADGSFATGVPPAPPEVGDAAAAVADGAGAGPATALPVAAAETAAAANTAVLPAVESVIPEGGSGLVTPRRVLLLLAGLLLVISLVAMLRRRRYQPVPADFSGLEAQPRRPAPAREPASAAIISTAAGAAAGVTAAPLASVDEPAAEVEEILADADSHLDNALYDEARDVVDMGLEQYPGELRLQDKLLEVHQAAGDAMAFTAAARAFYPQPDDSDPRWRSVAARGRLLAPGEPLFADGPRSTQESLTDDPGEPEAARGDAFGAGPPAFSAGQPYQPTASEGGEEAAPHEERHFAAAGDAEFDDVTAQADEPDVAPAVSWAHGEPVAEQAPTALDFDVQTNEPQQSEVAQAADTPRFEDYDLDGLTLHEPGAQTADSDRHEPASFAALDLDAGGSELSLLDAGALQAASDDSVVADSAAAQSNHPGADLSDDQGENQREDNWVPDAGPADIESAAPEYAGEPVPASTPAADLAAEPALDFGFDSDDDSLQAGLETGPDWHPSPATDSDLPEIDVPEQAETAVADPPPEAAFAVEGRAAPTEIEAVEGDAFGWDAPAAAPGEQQPAPTGPDSTGAGADLIGDEGGVEPESATSQSDADSADEDETAVKLDLARAYLDMGEPEMASSLLDEVNADGDDEQRREAAYLREKC